MITIKNSKTRTFFDCWSYLGPVPHLDKKMKQLFPAPKKEKKAIRIPLMDVSRFFSGECDMLYDVNEPPLEFDAPTIEIRGPLLNGAGLFLTTGGTRGEAVQDNPFNRPGNIAAGPKQDNTGG